MKTFSHAIYPAFLTIGAIILLGCSLGIFERSTSNMNAVIILILLGIAFGFIDSELS